MDGTQERAKSVRWRLGLIMALVYAVQGAWWPLLTVHLADLGVRNEQAGLIFSTLAIASLITPFSVGQLVDRLWDARLCLSAIYFIGSGMLAAAGFGWIRGGNGLFILFLIYWLVTAPGYGVLNALVMRNLTRPSEQFGAVRLWGTVGWVVVGWIVTLVLFAAGNGSKGRGAHEAFLVAAAASLVVGILGLYLPKTPPLVGNTTPNAKVMYSINLFIKDRHVMCYLIAAFAASTTIPFMYQVIPRDLEARGLPRGWIPTWLTLAQGPEIAGLAVLPWVLGKVGYRGALALGVFAWAIRYASLALDPPLWAAVAGLPLQGVGTACFTVGGQMFIDGKAPRNLRASAQTLNYMLTSGFGSLLGSVVAGRLSAAATGRSHLAFVAPAIIDGVIFVFIVCALGSRRKVFAGSTEAASAKVVSSGSSLDPQP